MRALARMLLAVGVLLSHSSVMAGHLDQNVFAKVQPGMTMDEVLKTCGPPDKKSENCGVRRTVSHCEVRFLYFDPKARQKIRSVIRFMDGAVVDKKRMY
jgi:hypothetical protein